MEEKKNKIFRGQLPVSVIYVLLGLCLALMPVETVNVLCKVVFGLVLIGAGLYHIFLFVFEKENATILDLFSGVIVLVIGVFLFMNPPVVIKLLTLMLGAFILVDSIWMLRGSLKLKKKGLGVWKAFLIESLIFVALGVLILMNPFSELKMTMQVAGWIFVANGGLDIIFYAILQHGLKKEVEDVKEEDKPEKGPDKETDKETDKEIDKKADKNTEMCEESNEENGDTKDEKSNRDKKWWRKRKETAEEEFFESSENNAVESNIDGKDIAAENCIDKGYAAGNDVQECDQAENDGNREPEEEVLEEWKD